MDALTGPRIAPGDGTPEQDWLAWLRLRGPAGCTLEELVPKGSRVVVVAPHPDDEILCAGGLMAMLAQRGHARLQLVAVSDGTASHPRSTLWTRARLSVARPRETREALGRLGVKCEVHRLGLPDGALRRHEDELAERLLGRLDEQDLVVSTWRHDGHPDHEATGRACARAAMGRKARLLEAPVWAWHWAVPGDSRLPWSRACALHLDADAAARKLQALRAFDSQLTPDPSTGADPVLRRTQFERAERPFEIYFRQEGA